jgi:hypothetical protein
LLLSLRCGSWCPELRAVRARLYWADQGLSSTALRVSKPLRAVGGLDHRLRGDLRDYEIDPPVQPTLLQDLVSILPFCKST